MRLTEEEVEILRRVAGAARDRGSDREPFMFSEDLGGSRISCQNPDVTIQARRGDMQALERTGMIAVSHRFGRDGFMFDLRPEAFEFIREIGDAVDEEVDHEVRRLIEEPEGFVKRHPSAHAKIAQANALLWEGVDSTSSNLTTIGHHSREAMLEFVSDLVVSAGVSGVVDSDPAKTVSRLRVVLADTESKTERAFLDALISYWGTVSDLVQRQEHGAAKEGEAVTWEDARRVVFQTLMVMYEVERAVSRSKP